eukprot:9202514-Pyramimonas_sp.AAC.2
MGRASELAGGVTRSVNNSFLGRRGPSNSLRKLHRGRREKAPGLSLHVPLLRPLGPLDTPPREEGANFKFLDVLGRATPEAPGDLRGLRRGKKEEAKDVDVSSPPWASQNSRGPRRKRRGEGTRFENGLLLLERLGPSGASE